jgi:predicted nuclease of predicted toxin-antitoxin system
MPDPELLERATALGRILFTQDVDLLREAAERQERGDPFIGVVYTHQCYVKIGQCIRNLELTAYAGEIEAFANRVEYLPLQ